MDALNSPPVVVALAFIGLVVIITVVAILRYQAQDVLKIWGGLSTIVGVMAGSMATYFFTKEPLQQAQQQVVATQERLAEVASKATAAETTLNELTRTYKPIGLSTDDPDYKKLFNKFESSSKNAEISSAYKNDIKARTELLKRLEDLKVDLGEVKDTASTAAVASPP
jgi:phage/plasmid-associated DNA primase